MRVTHSHDSKNFFAQIQKLADFVGGSRKRTAKFKSAQGLLYPEKRVRCMKLLSTTRWTSHDRAIDVVFNCYEAVIDTLEAFKSDPDRQASEMAGALLTQVTSFRFVITMILMRKIFSITTPLSVYLQSKAIDFFVAMAKVDSAVEQPRKLRNYDDI
jgi:hypothetical protein